LVRDNGPKLQLVSFTLPIALAATYRNYKHFSLPDYDRFQAVEAR